LLRLISSWGDSARRVRSCLAGIWPRSVGTKMRWEYGHMAALHRRIMAGARAPFLTRRTPTGQVALSWSIDRCSAHAQTETATRRGRQRDASDSFLDPYTTCICHTIYRHYPWGVSSMRRSFGEDMRVFWAWSDQEMWESQARAAIKEGPVDVMMLGQ
jgi:hypothetical protein